MRREEQKSKEKKKKKRKEAKKREEWRREGKKRGGKKRGKLSTNKTPVSLAKQSNDLHEHVHGCGVLRVASQKYGESYISRKFYSQDISSLILIVEKKDITEIR